MSDNEGTAEEPVKGVDTGTGVRVDVEAVHKRIKKLEAQLRAEIAKLGTETSHEISMAKSYLDSAFHWVKQRVTQLT